MKQLTFIALIIAFCLQTGFSQRYEQKRNTIGVHCGMNIATMTSHKLMATLKKDFMFGVSDKILLTVYTPLYIETGIYMSWKGYKIKGFHDSDTKLWYAQMPVMLNYHLYFNRRKTVYIDPHAGIYYAYGFKGKRKYEEQEINVIKEKEIKCSDWGIIAGVGIGIYNAHIGVRYEMGLSDVANSNLQTDYNQEMGYDNLRNRTLSVYIGVNF